MSQPKRTWQGVSQQQFKGGETISLSLGLEPTWLGLSQTHGTWFQGLVKLRFLVSHHRKNSERDNVVSKKRIYSDSERSACHRRSVSHRRGRVWLQNVARLVFIGWIISYANEWEGYSNYFLEGVEIYRIWSITHSLVFGQCLGTVMAPWVCHFTCCLRIKSWSCLPSWSHLIWIGLCCDLGLCHSFRSCVLPLSLLLVGLLTTLGRAQGLRWSVLSSWGAFVVLHVLCQLISSLFLPWLPTIPICHLKLNKGHGGWSLAYKKWDKNVSCPRAPQSPSQFHYQIVKMKCDDLWEAPKSYLASSMQSIERGFLPPMGSNGNIIPTALHLQLKWDTQ